MNIYDFHQFIDFLHMKRLLILSSIALVAAFNLNSSTGSPGGRAGSPSHGSTCAVGCHVGTPRFATSWITTNIPSAGMVAGNTYTITLTATDVTSNKFGFELTAESMSNGKEGTFTITNSSETALTPSGTVTHTLAGTAGSNNSKSWSVDWTAPSSLPADITFYAAVNAANDDGGNSGDIIYTTNLQAKIAPVGISNSSQSELKLYPNPASSEIHFSSQVEQVRIMDMNGKVLMSGSEIETMDVNQLNAGVYFVQLESEGKSSLQKLMIKQ